MKTTHFVLAVAASLSPLAAQTTWRVGPLINPVHDA
jgi:hypothetical protein